MVGGVEGGGACGLGTSKEPEGRTGKGKGNDEDVDMVGDMDDWGASRLGASKEPEGRTGEGKANDEDVEIA